MEDSKYFGITSLAISILTWGSMYVPVKGKATYDGILFLWYQCSGVAAIGIVVAIIAQIYEHSHKIIISNNNNNNNSYNNNIDSNNLHITLEGLISGLMYSFVLVIAPHGIKFQDLH